jgi:HisA/HisF family protein
VDVIPVIDLQGGTVVRARMGQRDRYRPIETPLAAGSRPLDVARGLLRLYPFGILYVADLDAIAGTGDNTGAVAQLRAEFPDLRLWVDNGIADRAAADRWLGSDLGELVLGSETQSDGALVRDLAGHPHVVLSIDFRGEAFHGPAALLDDAAAWPDKVIVMTLARVGSGAGPDWERLWAIRDVARQRAIYAAGGVRDAADLAALRDGGIAGALVASCLHDGRLQAEAIRRL